MNKSKLPIKKTSNLYTFQPAPHADSFLQTSTYGDTTTSCTTVVTTTHIMPVR
jgi:hypothetical protein